MAKIVLKNEQEEEFELIHQPNAGALSINTTDLIPLAVSLNSKVNYYEQSEIPTGDITAGSLWRDTDNNNLYIAYSDLGIITWFQL